MEILKRGKLPSEYTYEGTCYYCHTIISFQADEAELIYDARDGDYYSIKCPVCGCAINSSNKI